MLVGGPTWRTCLADLGGGPRWRCRPWRPSLEPRLISDLLCDKRQISDGVVWALAFGVLRLALSDWRSHLAVSVGATTLADQLGGVTRGGVGLSRNPSARFDARIGRFPAGRGGHRQLALSDWRRNLAESFGGVIWRSHLAESFGGATRRTCLAEPVGGVSWRTTLADHVGGPAWRCHPWRSWG